MSMWKKICAVAGTILAVVVAYFLGRSLPHRGRDGGAGADFREARDDAERAGDANRDLGIAISDSKRTAGDIANLNRDAQADVDKARSILQRARALMRASDTQDSGDSKPD